MLARLQGSHLVGADLDGSQIRGHGDIALPDPFGARRFAPGRRERAVRNRHVVGVRKDRDGVRGLVPRVVVAREPRGCAVGLTGNQHALFEFFPTHIAPCAHGRGGVSVVANLGANWCPWSKRGPDGDLTRGLLEPGGLAVDIHLGDGETRQIEFKRTDRFERFDLECGNPV